MSRHPRPSPASGTYGPTFCLCTLPVVYVPQKWGHTVWPLCLASPRTTHHVCVRSPVDGHLGCSHLWLLCVIPVFRALCRDLGVESEVDSLLRFSAAAGHVRGHVYRNHGLGVRLFGVTIQPTAGPLPTDPPSSQPYLGGTRKNSNP